MMQMNRNVENTLSQIENTLGELVSQGIVIFTIPSDYKIDLKNQIEQITWKNHISGRDVSSKILLQLINILVYCQVMHTKLYFWIIQ